MNRRLVVSVLLPSVLVFASTGIMIRSLSWAVLADLRSSSCVGGTAALSFVARGLCRLAVPAAATRPRWL